MVSHFSNKDIYFAEVSKVTETSADSDCNPLHNFPLNPMERMWGLVQQWSKSLRFHAVAAANLSVTSLTPPRKHKGQYPAQTDSHELKTTCVVLHFTYDTEISYNTFSP